MIIGEPSYWIIGCGLMGATDEEPLVWRDWYRIGEVVGWTRSRRTRSCCSSALFFQVTRDNASDCTGLVDDSPIVDELGDSGSEDPELADPSPAEVPLFSENKMRTKLMKNFQNIQIQVEYTPILFELEFLDGTWSNTRLRRIRYIVLRIFQYDGIRDSGTPRSMTWLCSWS